mmetsp:Transcript_9023/g.23175  ORF Transcript_9023/g.23175 Transcript_9023/m.23175 type:complete len:476 (+) Transcript_9023:58-1485(+)
MDKGVGARVHAARSFVLLGHRPRHTKPCRPRSITRTVGAAADDKISSRIGSWVSDDYNVDFAREYDRSIADLWTDENNNGCIVLSRSENKLNSRLLADELSKPVTIPPERLGYEDYKGNAELRQAVADYASSTFVRNVQIERDHLCVSAGCGAVIENTSLALCDWGDLALVPAPYYSFFDRDLGMRAGVKILPVFSSTTTGSLNVQDFEKCFQTATERGKSPRLLLLTNPNNPLGTVYSSKQYLDLLAWAAGRNLHVISDEIYANSIFGESGRRAFISALDLEPQLLRMGLSQFVSNNLHVVFGFTKDFGAAGLRIGCLHTRNAQLIKAWNALGYQCAISTHTQYAFTRILRNQTFVAHFLAENAAALRKTHGALTSALERANISYQDSSAGLFVWIDLRHLLETPSFESERTLWQRLAQDCRVLLSPGQFFHSKEPGFFRLCFAWMDPDALSVAVERLSKYEPRQNEAGGENKR